MIMAQSTDTAAFDAVIRDPSCWAQCSLGIEDMDITPLIENTDNVLLMNEYGGILFVLLGYSVFDAHTAFLPTGRGRHAIDAWQEAMRIIFEDIGAEAISTFVAFNNRAAQWFALHIGFQKLALGSVNGHRGQVYLMTKEDWVTSCQ